MATSQSLASIMEEMVSKVMEDAISTSIIFTQAPADEKVHQKGFLHNVYYILHNAHCAFLQLLSTAENLQHVFEASHAASWSSLLDHDESSSNINPILPGAASNQTRRRLVHNIPATLQSCSTTEQIRLEEEIANEIILEEQDAAALREAEVQADGAPGAGELVELLLEEVLLGIVGKQIADEDSSDFFSQDSQPQHLPPCSQDFAFFKAIEQTREDLSTAEGESCQEELSPPSQLVNSPSTSELGDLIGWVFIDTQSLIFSHPLRLPKSITILMFC